MLHLRRPRYVLPLLAPPPRDPKSGQLNKSIVKQWDAHILTKQHRTSVAREKALQVKVTGKRPAEDSSEGEVTKRVRVEVDVDQDEDGDEVQLGRLPEGFFSAGTHRPGTELDQEEQVDRPELEDVPGPPTPAVQAKTGDSELDDFLASLVDDPPPREETVTHTRLEPAKRSARAGASAYRTLEVPGVASYEAAPVRNALDSDRKAGAKEDELEPEPEPEETAQERRERLAREEREEIMGRLEEEERAQ